MSSAVDRLTREQWRTLLDEADPPTFHQLVDAVDNIGMIDGDPGAIVEAATDEGPLVVDDEASGNFEHFTLVDEINDETAREKPESSDETPGFEGAKQAGNAADSSDGDGNTLSGEMPTATVGEVHYPASMIERDWWVTWILDGEGRKRPVAPWQTGHAYPVTWNNELPEDEKPQTNFATAKRWFDFDLSHAGLSLPEDAQSDGLNLGIILPADRPDAEECISLIDWDDVRDPETGEIHPTAAEYIDKYGGYVEVSTSGEGLHQFVLGRLRKRGKFIAPIDDEPFIGDDRPQVEIYDGGRHVAMTGRHVEGTSLDVITDGQPYIDELITEYADAEKDAGHRVYDPETGEYDGEGDSGDGENSGEVPEPKTGEYLGPEIDDLRETKPDGRSLAYHAVVEAFYRGGGDTDGFAHIQNWRLEGFAAALGERDDLEPEDVKDDLGGDYLDDTTVECGCRHETPYRVDYAYERATSGRLEAPSWGTLVAYGVLPPELLDDEDEHTETPRDILGLDVVVEPAHALTAAAAVEPDDLDTPLPELEREGVDDVAVAVAIAEDMIADATEFPTDGDYTEAYYRARDHYGAPLPKYLDNSTLEERADLCIAAVKRVEPKHILDAVDSEITVESPSGKPTAKLNPTWEESESGERILVGYGRGFYCVEDETSFSPIQLVALEHGYIDTEDEYPRGEAFKQSYRLLREKYGAPIPKWRATLLEHVAVLPPSVRVLQGSAMDKNLDDVYAETEALLRDALSVRDRAQLVTVVPNGGKTFSVAKIADEQPVLYTAERNDLKQQMADYAAEIREDDGMDAEPTIKHLPILAEKTIDDAVLREATGEIREHGRRLLRDREELLDRVGGYLGEEFDEDEYGGEDDEIDLDRASCPVASGEHGAAWALAVQTARSLGHEPSKIHQYDTALFGEPLPCQEETAECAYTEAWDRIRQPENQADILIGSPGHAYVDSATTYFDTDENGDRVEKPRSVVVDEFLGDAYMDDYGERSVDHAVWAAEALVGVDNREDLLAAGLDTDTWVDCWLDGDGEEYHDAGEIAELLEAGAALCEAAEDAEQLLEGGLDATVGTINVRNLRDALEALTGEDADLSSVDDTLTEIIDQLGADADREYATGDAEVAGRLYDLLDSLETIHEGVTRAVGVSGGRPLEAQLRDAVENFRAGGDLRELLLAAADAIAEGEPVGLIHAARTALCGGREGCRELAVFADDGYAHPDAWALLAGVIATDTAEVDTATFAFDGDDGGVFKRLERNGATIIADKNHHGAIVADPPAFTDITGGKCPVVGLDATARPKLWRLALGRDTERRDIHDSPAERRRFLREVMNLRVIQTSNDPLPYHGDPEGKNFGEDIELIRTVAEKYTGDHTDAVDEEDPAVISTLKTINHLKESLEGDTSDLINYENMKGSDALGDRQVGVVLGSCHYGDAKPEKWGLLAGEDAGRGDSRGDRLDYGSEVANTYLAHMREDYTMQAILRAGRNDDESVVFAHTSALRDDLPVEDEAAVLSVHSKGTLAVAEAASEFTDRAFTAPEIADELGDDNIGLRQVQNVLADLRENGYLRVENDGGRGNAFEYTVEEDPGLAEVDLPGGDSNADGENEISSIKNQYTWNFVFDRDNSRDSGVIPPSTPEIPATDTTTAPVDAADPPS